MTIGRLISAVCCTALLCSCAHRKETNTSAAVVGPGKSVTPAQRVKHFFPLGVDWSNATPTQISDAVLAAVKSKPEAASDIASTALDEAQKSGRFQVLNGKNGKSDIDPEPRSFLGNLLFRAR